MNLNQISSIRMCLHLVRHYLKIKKLLNRSILFENCHARLVFLEQHLATMNVDNISNEEQGLLFAEELEELCWDEKDWYKIDLI